jgi:hypothetical protein
MNSSRSNHSAKTTMLSATVSGHMDTASSKGSKWDETTSTGNEFMRKFYFERSKTAKERTNPLQNLSSDKLKEVESWISLSLRQEKGELDCSVSELIN